MPTIDSDVDPGQFVSRHFGSASPEQLRQSETRRSRLERWAQVVGHDGISLSLNPTEGETARVKFDGDTPDIDIPSWEIPQPITDIQREAYDFLIQRTMTLHEVGHVNYTDQDALDSVMADVDSDRREQFHTIWNALEDGAIESQLRGDFSVSDELEVTNANYMGSHGRSKSYGAMDATLRACLDLAVYDTGDLRDLRDENVSRLEFEDESVRETFEGDILPEVESAIPDIVGESDPVDRTERIHELWTDIEPHIEPGDEPDIQDIDAKGDHADQDSGSGSPADQLDSIDPSEISDRIDGVLNGEGPGDVDDDRENGSADRSEGSTTDDSEDDQGDSTGGRSDSASADDDRVSATDDVNSPERDQNGLGGPDSERADQTGAHADRTENSDGEDGSAPSNQVEQDREATSADSGATPERSSGDDRESGADGTPEPEPETPERESEEATDGANSGTSRDDTGGSEELQRSGDTAEDASDSGGVSGDSGVETGDINTDPAPDPALEDGYLERVADEHARREDDLETLEQEVDAFSRTLERLEELDETPTELDIPTGGDVRRNAWANTRRQGTQLRQILEDQLRQERRSSWERGRPSGRVDPRSLSRIARSDPRIFRQRVSPDEKDYSAALVLDRSGSMSGDIRHAEEATTALAYALEKIDIETCVIDMCHSKPRLAKPYGRDVEPSLDSLLTGETGGGTPLSDALRLARRRVEDREGTPFCIVVTDGQPDDQQDYVDELRATTFPVLGVYLAFKKTGPDSVSRSVQESARLFDQRKIVTNENRLVHSLRHLCREVMF